MRRWSSPCFCLCFWPWFSPWWRWGRPGTRARVMVNASREGARFGVLFNQDGLSNQQVEDHVQAVLDQAGFAMPVEVSATGADGLPGTMVTVVVTAQYQLNVLGALIPGLGNDDDNPGGVTLSATTVMRHE